MKVHSDGCPFHEGVPEFPSSASCTCSEHVRCPTHSDKRRDETASIGTKTRYMMFLIINLVFPVLMRTALDLRHLTTSVVSIFLFALVWFLSQAFWIFVIYGEWAPAVILEAKGAPEIAQ
uniref:Uncharacterized protein n=1 Tax=Noctiluca scintillans TaxID=2966 RepID=A0A7S1AFW7_NOCSC|mmetsp:Transcript_44731/g.118671  ORF Transcript_44731/g.118671 Transcript_44731/m.118671 type:complete len:120 (+) Transcript_44731:71-430(+)